MTNESKQPALIAYAVTEKPATEHEEKQSFFNRIGVAFANKKGGYKIILAAVPVNGEILLFPPKEPDSEA